MCAQRVAWHNDEVLTAEHFQHLEAWIEGLVYPLAAANGWGLTRFEGELDLNRLPLLSVPDGWTKKGPELETWCTIQPLRARTPVGRLLEVTQESRLRLAFDAQQIDLAADALPVYLIPSGLPEDAAPMRPYEPAVALKSQLSAAAQRDAIQIAEFGVTAGRPLPNDHFIPMCADVGASERLTRAAADVAAAAAGCRQSVLATMKTARELHTISGEQFVRLEALRAADRVCWSLGLLLADPRAPVRRLVAAARAAVRQANDAVQGLGFEASLLASGADRLDGFAGQPNLYPVFEQLRVTCANLRGWVAGLSLTDEAAPPVADIPHGDGQITDVVGTRWRRVAIPLHRPLGASLGPGARVRVQLRTTNHAPEGEVRVHPTAAPGLKLNGELVAHSCQLPANSEGRLAAFEYTPSDEDRAADVLVFYVQRKVADVLPQAGGVLSAAVVQIIPV